MMPNYEPSKYDYIEKIHSVVQQIMSEQTNLTIITYMIRTDISEGIAAVTIRLTEK